MSEPAALTRVRDRLPGLAALAAIAVVARLVGDVVPGASPLVVAVAVGATVANTLGAPARFAPGIATHKLLLETGIVLLGASLSLGALLAAGPTLALLAVGVVALGLLTVEALSRLAGLRDRTASLLAAGASVCGVSAIAATAGSCDADESSVAYAAGTILLFDAVTLAVFPPLGHALGLSQRAFGVWAGLSMFSTGPVTAAGFTYGQVAGEWATVTKLARNTLIGAVALGYSVWYAGDGDDVESGEARSLLGRVAAGVPPFLVGFLGLAALANAGVFTEATRAFLASTSDGLFLLAFAGLGFELRAARLRETGIRPVAVVGASLCLVSVVAFVLVTTLL